MATVWEIVSGNSSLPSGSFWGHLNNQEGGGSGYILVDLLNVEVEQAMIEVDLAEISIDVEIDDDNLDVEIDNSDIDVEVIS